MHPSLCISLCILLPQVHCCLVLLAGVTDMFMFCKISDWWSQRLSRSLSNSYTTGCFFCFAFSAITLGARIWLAVLLFVQNAACSSEMKVSVCDFSLFNSMLESVLPKWLLFCSFGIPASHLYLVALSELLVSIPLVLPYFHAHCLHSWCQYAWFSNS